MRVGIGAVMEVLTGEASGRDVGHGGPRLERRHGDLLLSLQHGLCEHVDSFVCLNYKN